MTWFFIALGAPFLWSIVNHVDKYLLSKHSTNSSVGSLMIFSTFAGIIVVAIAPFFSDSIFLLGLVSTVTLLSAGMIAALSITFYLYALDEEEASIVVPLMQLIPVFGYLFGYLFLGETLTTQQIIAFGIIVFGSVILSLDLVEENKYKIKIKVLMLMIGCTVLFALYETMFKFVAVDVGFVEATFWEHLGLLTYGIILFSFFPKFRNGFKLIVTQKSKRIEILGLNIGSEILTIIGNVLTNYALLLAPIVLVLLVGSFQPVFVFTIGILLTIFFPRISEENITSKHLIHKAFSILIILLGTYLLLK